MACTTKLGYTKSQEPPQEVLVVPTPEDAQRKISGKLICGASPAAGPRPAIYLGSSGFPEAPLNSDSDNPPCHLL